MKILFYAIPRELITLSLDSAIGHIVRQKLNTITSDPFIRDSQKNHVLT